MNKSPNCPKCESRLVSLDVPNTYICNKCSFMYELQKDGTLKDIWYYDY